MKLDKARSLFARCGWCQCLPIWAQLLALMFLILIIAAGFLAGKIHARDIVIGRQAKFANQHPQFGSVSADNSLPEAEAKLAPQDSSDPDDARAYKLDETTYAQAKCLDGSQAMYYHRPGFGNGTKSWLLFHQGAGFCGSFGDCYQRSLDNNFSNGDGSGGTEGETDGSVMNFKTSHSHHFFLITNSTLSPLLYNWNHVFLRYCDGTYQGSDLKEPYNYTLEDGTNVPLYFRGRAITEAHMHSLVTQWHKKPGADDSEAVRMADAENIVISGCSSGAVRTYAHMDRIRDIIMGDIKQVREKEKLNKDLPTISAFPDSGFYLDNDMYRAPKPFLVNGPHDHPPGVNGSFLLNANCTKASNKKYNSLGACVVGAFAAKFQTTPWFAAQSRHDSDQQGCDVECPDGDPMQKCINDHGILLSETMKAVLKSTTGRRDRHRNGAFVDGCSRHCSWLPQSHDGFPVPVPGPLDERQGKTSMQLFSDWWHIEVKKREIPASGQEYLALNPLEFYSSQDNSTYPCDQCCEGTGKLNMSIGRERSIMIGVL